MRNTVFWLVMILVGMIVRPTDLVASPIIDFKPEKSTRIIQNFYNIPLKYITTYDISPLLRTLCSECQWMVDHQSQTIGIVTTRSQWVKFRGAIRKMDQLPGMVVLTIDILEVTNTSNESYKQLLHQLSSPVVLKNPEHLNNDLQFLVNTGVAKTISSPKIVTKSGKEATIKVGDRIPITNITQSTTSTLQQINYVDSGIDVTIKPLVHASQRIDLGIALTYKLISGYVSSSSGGDIPMFASRATNVAIQVSSNSTVIFAGLLDQSNHITVESVPVLGDIPLLGHLFRFTKKRHRQTDLLFKIHVTVL